MKKFATIFILFTLFYSSLAVEPVFNLVSNNRDSAIYQSNDTLYYAYYKPKLFTFVKKTLLNVYETPQELFKKQNLKGLAVMTASTGILLYFDQDLIDISQQFGRYIGLSQDNNTFNLTPWKELPLYVPTDISSGLYYIGDGITELSVNLGFYIYGNIAGDARALRTASELTEGIATVGIYIQLLKHISGRETPMRATEPRGVWRPLPTLKEYHSSVPKYDAFPSGHLATAMVTTTIISMNYPEYKFIKPLCYSLIALCGYQMMNNGVHWASDYPFAIAMGYAIGRIAVNNGRNLSIKKSTLGNHIPQKPKTVFNLKPTLFGYDGAGLSLSVKF